MSIEAIINGVIEVEGGYVNHPSDPGGATNMGITEAVARSAGYKGDMRNLPRSTAYSIYYTRYVVAPNFDDVFARDPKVAEELIDSGVNAGTDRAAKWFQAALNSLNRRQADYPDINEDGDVGGKTLASFDAFRKARGKSATAIMLRALDALQGAHYMSLAKGNSKFEDFLNGWLLNRIGNVAA
ncbi:MAG: glycosyl hydrolase 108 family protein [Pseudomonadota bacterium]